MQYKAGVCVGGVSKVTHINMFIVPLFVIEKKIDYQWPIHREMA